MNIIFLTQRLAVGGAERQLVSLAQGLAARGHRATIATFYPGGALASGLAEAGVRHFDVSKRGRFDVVGPLLRLGRLLAAEQPHVVNSWLTVPNIVTGTFRALGCRWPLIWSIRHAIDDFSMFDWLARATDAVEPHLARFANRIVVNSEAGRLRAIAAGFPADRMVVLPNGIDTDRFRPDPEGAHLLRRAWGIPDNALLVGHPARIDPTKGHDTFIDAAALLAATDARLHFVCPGTGDSKLLKELQARTHSLGLTARMHWPGLVLDMPAAYSALDLAVMCSSSEGWPNVVGEALACGVPMVVTDVGDAARIVPVGIPVVPPNDPATLATAIRHAVGERRTAPVEALRRHIEVSFARRAMLDRSEALLTSVVASRRP